MSFDKRDFIIEKHYLRLFMKYIYFFDTCTFPFTCNSNDSPFINAISANLDKVDGLSTNGEILIKVIISLL